MPRRPPQLVSTEALGSRESTVSVTLEVSTLLFGGSAEAAEVDANEPIRRSEVHNQLRNWWRILYAPAFTCLKDLAAAEARLWGNTSVPGKVMTRVTVVSPGKMVDAIKLVPTVRGTSLRPEFHGWPAYALWPFQGKSQGLHISEHPTCPLQQVRFCVDVTLQSGLPGADGAQEQVEAALWAWVSFGGIGARTRRGVGSLRVVEGDLRLPEQLPVTPAGDPIPLVTTLPGTMFLGGPHEEIQLAWSAAVDVYLHFRQGVGFARDKGRPRDKGRRGKPLPGRSRYPEADTIRDLYLSKNPVLPLLHQPRVGPRGFPRADLGLPITFHFQQSSGRPRTSADPPDHLLTSAKHGRTRFASPVITKPYWDGDAYRPLVMILDSPHVWESGDLRIIGEDDKNSRSLKDGEGNAMRYSINKAILREQANLPESSLKNVGPLDGALAREAFTNMLRRDNQFTESDLHGNPIETAR